MTTETITAFLLIAVPTAFNVAFFELGRAFEYPNILRKEPDEILRRFVAGGSGLILRWEALLVSALLMLPLAVLLAIVLAAAPALSVLSVVVGATAAIVQGLGLVRWPFAVPELARRYVAAPEGPEGDATRRTVEVVFATLHRLLGVGIGEHLGYLFTGLWTLLVSGSILSTTVLPGWLAVVGIVIGVALLIGTLEFVGPNERDGWHLAGIIVPIAYVAWSVWLDRARCLPARLKDRPMTAVIGYMVVATLAIVAALLAAGPHHVVRRDPTFELEKVSDRLVEILSALTGFAVTGLIFLVTQSNQVPDPNGTAFTTVLAMFVVAYMGYYSSGVLIANVSHRAQDPTFDLAAAQYAGASISLFSVILGWFALKPMFETFGLTAIAAADRLAVDRWSHRRIRAAGDRPISDRLRLSAYDGADRRVRRRRDGRVRPCRRGVGTEPAIARRHARADPRGVRRWIGGVCRDDPASDRRAAGTSGTAPWGPLASRDHRVRAGRDGPDRLLAPGGAGARLRRRGSLQAVLPAWCRRHAGLPDRAAGQVRAVGYLAR